MRYIFRQRLCSKHLLEKDNTVVEARTTLLQRKLLPNSAPVNLLGVVTKTYNKWYLCEKGKQPWSKNTGNKKYRVLLQMISYDNFKDKWRVCDPSADGTKWKKTESYYVLVDAGDIHDVVGSLIEC